MLSEQRYKEIERLLDQEGTIKTSDLCQLLQTSRETVRRDLEIMEDKGLLKRVHGGAVRTGEAEEKNTSYTSFQKRQSEHLSDKEKIARKAAEYISEGQAIALDSGTTALALARVIKTRFHSLTVVTNSLAIAKELADTEGITLVVTGGVYRADEEAFVSDIATLIFSRINVDLFFLTTCGISVERGVTYQRMDEILVQNKMMEAAARTVVITDSSKIGVNSLVKMCDVSRISMIITDSGVSRQQAEAFQAAGIPVAVSED